MSTPGKVLVVVFLLTSLIWIVLSSKVSQLNTNGNTRLHELSVQVEKLGADLEQTRHEVHSLLDQTAQTQELVDRDYTRLRSTQAEVEKAGSQIREALSRVQYQLATVEETIKSGQTALANRNIELQEETKGLADAKAEVQALIADSSKLMDRLTTLRKDFQTVYRSNVEMLGKRGR